MAWARWTRRQRLVIVLAHLFGVTLAVALLLAGWYLVATVLAALAVVGLLIDRARRYG